MATEEAEQFFIDIDELQSQASRTRVLSSLQLTKHAHTQGISAQDISKLKSNGIATVLGVIQTTRRQLTKIKVRSLSRSLHSPNDSTH